MGADETGRGAPAVMDVPASVRTVLVRAAAQTLGSLDTALVPVPLQRVRTFAPRRRAGAGAAPLWRALVDDDGFRHAVAADWARTHGPAATEPSDEAPEATGEDGPDRADASRDDPVGDDPSGTDATDETPAAVREWAAEAFLLRPEGWEAVVERARTLDDAVASERVERAEAAGLRRERDRLAAQVVELRAAAEEAGGQAVALASELATVRRSERRLRADADRARAEARAALEAATTERAAAESALRDAREERRAASIELARSRAERDEARRALTSNADLATARARLLLDTVVDAAVGLRRELALGPSTTTPADQVAAATPGSAPGSSRPGSRGRAADDPAFLDDLLSVPHTHLVVDGYNVTKTGFGELPLADQRERLVSGLLRVAASGAEVTVCFDGADVAPRAVRAPRDVRVLFSSGEIADDLVRRLVAAEPPGRPVVVVTSDRAVADDAQAMGAVSVPAQVLLARLARR